jgi:hypothetical protein
MNDDYPEVLVKIYGKERYESIGLMVTLFLIFSEPLKGKEYAGRTSLTISGDYSMLKEKQYRTLFWVI